MTKDLSAGILKINVSRIIGEEMVPLAKFLNDRQVIVKYFFIEMFVYDDILYKCS